MENPQRGRRKAMAEINVVPYIDVMLVLLIIFMVTAPMLTQGVQVELPKVNSEAIKLDQNEEPIVVSVKADSTYYLNVGGKIDEPKSVETIADYVGKITKEKPHTQVLIQGAETVPYGSVVILMANLQGAGVTNIGLITDVPDDNKRKK